MDFAGALPLILQGVPMARVEWRGSYRYVTMQYDGAAPIDMICAIGPEAFDAKQASVVLDDISVPPLTDTFGTEHLMPARWAPSAEDAGADDWEIYDPTLPIAVGRDAWRRSHGFKPAPPAAVIETVGANPQPLWLSLGACFAVGVVAYIVWKLFT